MVRELLEDLIIFSNRIDLSGVTQAAIAHAQFETIHPFADGNGRTGRCLIHLILRRRGLSRRVVPPVSVVLAANASRYVEGLTAFRGESLTEWCEMFADALSASADRAVDLGEQIRTLKADWFERAGRPNKRSTARRLIEGLVGHPVVSLESTEELLGVSNEAARLALARLEEAGVVRQVTLGKRNRAWASTEVFDLLDEFEAETRNTAI
jgi:Fic family protein